MVCPYRITKKIYSVPYERGTTVEEIYPECMGFKCPYYTEHETTAIVIPVCSKVSKEV